MDFMGAAISSSDGDPYKVKIEQAPPGEKEKRQSRQVTFEEARKGNEGKKGESGIDDKGMKETTPSARRRTE